MAHLKFLCLLLVFTDLISSGLAQSKAKTTSLQIPEVKQGNLITEKLPSVILLENRIGLDPNRTIKVYLPPGYASSKKSYPVIYYFHNIFWSVEKMFENGNVVKLLDRGITSGMIQDFIFVAADFSTPTTGSIYENSPISGRWLDFITKELVPFIDKRFRTLPHRNSRGLAGDFMGGRGALKLAMVHADLFSVVYALHPVATGSGQIPWSYVQVDWKKLYQCKTVDELGGDGRSKLFITISQAFLPNPNRPPFYCDYFMEAEKGEPKLHTANTKKTKDGFLLDATLEESASNLRSMRGIAFDWGRFDPTQAHVYSNQDFSRKLEDLGIEHEAEEYRGDPWDKTWTENGRFYSRLLPFFERHLVFEPAN
ncbi:alpha/beta hydrolase-fold protein [Cytophagaceae bacterium DM2B3-1]|uniref:Alpha/beta hydrolase-fold protein n=1 Tax=Xanthocytophaga flava TaxID=3048013 RepID=A0ABT7CEG5_9BACT|nr:alpha/beta hydrolase-fold protein [Xanthocytophaga flavus]MDJ1468942.1 alpha/beta hydrolase-fold protein [Xanthocytophaga flavus]MDJ1492116.1 alpha/beta hydrolase-fold protein [Xanthocytophaga flavus]